MNTTIKKTGMRNNPLLQRTDRKSTAGDKKTRKQENNSADSGSSLQRKTFFMEKEVFEQLRTFAFHKREKIYRVVNEAIREYIKANS